MRIGVHLGEVLFQDDLPFGESLVIAARLESLAEPGGVLVSSAVMDAVASRISATFEEMGVRSLKHSPRRIATFSVTAAPGTAGLDITAAGGPLDYTVLRGRTPAQAEEAPAPDRAAERSEGRGFGGAGGCDGENRWGGGSRDGFAAPRRA